MEQACFLWVQWEEGIHSIVSNYWLTRSPLKGCISVVLGDACLPIHRKKERAKERRSPPLVGWGR